MCSPKSLVVVKFVHVPLHYLMGGGGAGGKGGEEEGEKEKKNCT